MALFITFEAPLSGMSINPARTLASAVPAGLFDHLWIYFVAPPLGMLVAGEIYFRTRHRHEPCAKIASQPGPTLHSLRLRANRSAPRIDEPCVSGSA